MLGIAKIFFLFRGATGPLTSLVPKAEFLTFFLSAATIQCVVWSANGDGSALTSEASSKVNLLADNTYQINKG